MSSMPLPTNHMSPPAPVPSSMTTQNSQTVSSDRDAAFVQTYIPLFSAPEVATDHAVPRPLSQDPLAQCLSGQDVAASALTDPSRVDEAIAPSVITHTASSTVTPSNAATTFCHSTDYSSLSSPVLPPPPQLQPSGSMPSAAVQQAHSFTVPHPIRPSNKNPSVQRLALSSTVSSPHLILTGLSFLLSRLNEMVFILFSYVHFFNSHKVVLKYSLATLEMKLFYPVASSCQEIYIKDPSLWACLSFQIYRF